MSGARLRVSQEDEDLISVFAAELDAAGLGAWASTLGGARAFCAHYGGPAGFAGLGVEEQLAMPGHLRQFACWLMVTGRMRVSAEYLARADQRLGTVARSHFPDLHGRFVATAAMLGSNHIWATHQWNVLAQLAALHGVTPDQVSAEQVEEGGAALVDAFARPGRPKAGQRTRTSLVRLKATLFHAGLVDAPPRLHKPNTGAKRAAEWARVSPTFAATAQRYVEQIRLSLRPSTVTDADGSWAATWLRQLPRSARWPTSPAATSRATRPGWPSALASAGGPCTATPSGPSCSLSARSSSASPSGAMKTHRCVP